MRIFLFILLNYIFHNIAFASDKYDSQEYRSDMFMMCSTSDEMSWWEVPFSYFQSSSFTIWFVFVVLFIIFVSIKLYFRYSK